MSLHPRQDFQRFLRWMGISGCPLLSEVCYDRNLISSFFRIQEKILQSLGWGWPWMGSSKLASPFWAFAVTDGSIDDYSDWSVVWALREARISMFEYFLVSFEPLYPEQKIEGGRDGTPRKWVELCWSQESQTCPSSRFLAAILVRHSWACYILLHSF